MKLYEDFGPVKGLFALFDFRLVGAALLFFDHYICVYQSNATIKSDGAHCLLCAFSCWLAKVI